MNGNFSSPEMKTLKKWIGESENIVFFGGAGVSTESGIPDYRSEDGLYRQKFDYPPEEILSHRFLLEKPEIFYRFCREKLLYPDAQPSGAHCALAELERQGKLKWVITQNIDGLHQAAGCRRVVELHGSMHRNYCMRCKKEWSFDEVLNAAGIPRCDCGGIIRPDVVLYGESLDERAINAAIKAIEQADVLIVAGTSLTVYPAAGFVSCYRGHKLVLINLEETPIDARADLVLHMRVGEALSGAVFEA